MLPPWRFGESEEGSCWLLCPLLLGARVQRGSDSRRQTEHLVCPLQLPAGVSPCFIPREAARAPARLEIHPGLSEAELGEHQLGHHPGLKSTGMFQLSFLMPGRCQQWAAPFLWLLSLLAWITFSAKILQLNIA